MNSPFDDSFSRLDVDLVINSLRKASLKDSDISSPLLPADKQLNISNLSDLVPDENSFSEKLNDTDEEQYNRMKPGELDEVEEEEDDEEISDNKQTSEKPDLSVSDQPFLTHESVESTIILDSL